MGGIQAEPLFHLQQNLTDEWRLIGTLLLHADRCHFHVLMRLFSSSLMK
jgi:hypothetical protein